jgi:hypothetical protein
MRAPRILAPLASATALASAATIGCSLRPWTPSVSVAYWAQGVPAARPTALPTSADAMARWQLPAENPWARYVKLTLLGSLDAFGSDAALPDVSRLEVVATADDAASHLADAGVPNDAAFVVDLRGAGSVTFGAKLSQRSPRAIAAIPTFNNWPADDELIPAEETLAAMITDRPSAPVYGDPGRPVFLLDAWRLAYRYDEPDDVTYDNRYVLGPADLPDAPALRGQGLAKVIYVVEDLDETETEEDDLYATALAWQSAGIQLYLVDLEFLRGLPAGRDWSAALEKHRYVVQPRETVFDDHGFWVRAHGGFGGVHARPSVIHGGRGSHGGFHGGGG